MNDDSINKLKEIFVAVFELSPDVDVTQARQMNTPKWDSLATVSLTAAIESEFGINIGIEEALRLSSYQATLLFLEEKIK